MVILEPQDLPLFSGPRLSLLVLVISSPGNSAVRETIRSLAHLIIQYTFPAVFWHKLQHFIGSLGLDIGSANLALHS